MSLPITFKGIALFTPGGDLIYCIDPNKQNQWHLHLCVALQEILDLPEPPHFLVPCYTATLDLWLNPTTQKVEIFAEAYPLVLRYQSTLNAIFGTDSVSWQSVSRIEGACEPLVLSTYRTQFPQLWEEHDLILQINPLGQELQDRWFDNRQSSNSPTTVNAAKSASLLEDIPTEVNSTPVTQGYVLRLFVSGQSPTTEKALKRLHQFFEESLQLPYTLKVIDILKHPDLAEADQILATPTLVRVWPLPVRRLVGELDNLDRVIHVISSV